MENEERKILIDELDVISEYLEERAYNAKPFVKVEVLKVLEFVSRRLAELTEEEG
jgi:hypothetical protein